MKALFVELPAFAKYRSEYLSEEAFRGLQNFLMATPEAGDVIEGTGGLRVIYYWWVSGAQFCLFTLYNKDEMVGLSPKERKLLKDLIKKELEVRR